MADVGAEPLVASVVMGLPLFCFLAKIVPGQLLSAEAVDRAALVAMVTIAVAAPA